jgi:putative transposase
MRLPGDHESRSKGTGQKRWSNRWKVALNAFETTFDGRLSTGRK